jgi:hypothetical protein
MSVQSLNTTRRRPLEIGNVLGAMGQAFSKNFWPMMALAAAVVGLPGAVSGVLQLNYMQGAVARGGLDTSSPTYWAVVAGAVSVQLVTSYVLQAALIHAVVSSLRRRPASLSESLATGLRYVGHSVAIALMVWVMVLTGSILLIVPGIILALATSVAVPIAVVEGRNPFAAIGRSFSLTNGYKGTILILAVIYFLLYIALSFVFGIGFGMVTVTVAQSSPVVAAHIQGGFVTPLIQSVVSLVTGSGIAALYFELRTVKEGFGADDLATIFA